MEDARPNSLAVFRWWILVIPLAIVLVVMLFAFPAYRDYQRREQAREKLQELGKAIEAHELKYRELGPIPPMPAIQVPEKK
jgi:hypothetical protein